MNFDELKARWEQASTEQEARMRLNPEALRAIAQRRSGSALRSMRVTLVLEAALNAAGVLAIGAFLGDHVREPRWAIPAVVLHLLALLALVSVVRQLVQWMQVDPSSPVAQLQVRLERLRVLRARTVLWTLAIAPLAWTPGLIVGLKGMFGLDAYGLFGTPWLIANTGFGVALLALARWLSRRFAGQLEGSPRAERLAGLLSGSTLDQAIRDLSSAAAFEREM